MKDVFSVENLLSSILSPFKRNTHMNKDDKLIWSRDLEKYSHGEFSFAVVQANAPLEDYSQVVTGQNATFIGIYDGHGGHEASKYVSENLSKHLLKLARVNRTMSEEVLTTAFSKTENGYLTLVGRAFELRPLIAATGSCCLVGVIWERTLYVANLGDSRAVMGRLDKGSKKITAEQLTSDHNASLEEIRNELWSLHQYDPDILVQKQGTWRIKGIIQVSRAIGDAYLKMQEFALGPEFKRFYLAEPLRRPLIRADPTILTRDLKPTDKFLIFASDGLWEHVTNQEAVEFVYKKPRLGIARRLLCYAIKKAAKKLKMTYGDFKKLHPRERRQYHDDITIVITFADREMSDNNTFVADLSVRGFVDTVGSSNFDFSGEFCG